MLPRATYLHGPDFLRAFLHLVQVFGAGRRVGNELLGAFARHQFVGRTCAELVEIDRHALGNLALGRSGAGGYQLLPYGGLEGLVDGLTFAAGGEGEGEQKQRQKGSMHKSYVGTGSAISSPISTQSW